MPKKPKSLWCFLLFAAGLRLAVPDPTQAANPDSPFPPGSLTLEESLRHAVRNRPELVGWQLDLEAATVKFNQALLPPNPELGFELDNLVGSIPDDEVREATIAIRQTIEIGGKALARRNRGEAERHRLRQEQQTAWLELAAEVRVAFLEVQAARERLALQREAEQIAIDLAAITHERVAAGELAATEALRAEAKMAESKAESDKLLRLQSEAELNLAVLLLEPDRAPVTVDGILPQEVAIPDRPTLLARIDATPQLALRRSEIQLANADLVLAKANAWSDPALSLALRESPGKDGRAILVGVSVPLPLFQRNQVAVAETQAAAGKAARNERSTAVRLAAEVTKSHALLVAADQEARTLRREVLNQARAAAAAVREGFQFGKFRYSDVVEASQFLVTVKIRHLDAIIELNRAAIALDRLLGKPTLPAITLDQSAAADDRSNP